MRSLGFFLMTEKGFSVINEIQKSRPQYLSSINFVVGARDSGIENDYYDEIKKKCEDIGIEFFNRKKVDVAKLNAEYVFAISWRWLIKSRSFQLIVLHDSLLPKYRGFNPLVTALIEGDNEIGVTALEAVKEFDSGNIYEQVRTKIDYPIKIKEAIKNISELCNEIIFRLLDKIDNSNLSSYSQNEKNVTYSLWRDASDYRVDWHQGAKRIERFVNAVGPPYKGALTTYDDLDIRLLEVETKADIRISNRTTGKIFKIDNNCPVVVCDNGLLQINKAISDADNKVVRFKKLRVRLQ